VTKAKPLAIAGIVMVIAFFGPWIDVLGRLKLSGWTLAHEPMLGWKRHVLWAYPAGGLALALAAWRGAASARTLALALGVFVVGLALYRTFDGLVASLRYGAWLTIAAAVAVIAAGARGQRESAMLAGVVVIAGFFLPWVGRDLASMSGFDLARLASPPAGLGLPSPSWLFVVPLLGAVATLASLTARTRRAAILAGAGILVVLAYLYVRTVNLFVGWGAWLTLAAGAAALLGVLLARPAPLTPVSRRC
jgi:hypothetical protein